MKAVDCQGFAGAFDLAVVNAGFDIVGKREEAGGFGVPLVEGNRHLLGDFPIQASDPRDWEPVDVPLVFGNPPCSGFSNLSVAIQQNGERVDWRGINASSNKCMWNLVDYAARCDAEMVVFESVQGAGRAGHPLMRALRDRLEEKSGHSYGLWHVFHSNASVGGAAIRKRYFFVASRVPFGINSPVIGRIGTLWDAIGDLAHQKLEQGPHPYRRKPVSDFNQDLRSLTGEVTGHVTHPSRRGERLAWLAEQADWQPGERSRDVFYRVAGFAEDDHEKADLPDCWYDRHGKLIGRSDRFEGPYAALRWDFDKPARVLPGGALEEAVHPTQARTFTHREVARIMGFPDDWSCDPAIEAGSRGTKWWGKQLPVQSAEWIAKWAKRSLEGRPGLWHGTPIGDAEYLINVTNDWKAVYDFRNRLHGVDSRSKKLREEMEARPA